MRRVARSLGQWVGLLFVVAPLVLFLVVPLLSVVILSFSGKPYALLDYMFRADIGALVGRLSQDITLKYYQEFLKGTLFFTSLKNSLVLGFGVTVGASIIGTTLAFTVTRTLMPFRRVIHFLSLLPLIVPAFIGGYALSQLLGDRGVVTGLVRGLFGGEGAVFNLYTPLGIAVIQTSFLFPMVYLSVSAIFENIDSNLEEAALTQGAPRWFAVLTTTVPMATPGIAAGALLVFTNSIADYGTFGLLGPRGYPLIAVEAYRELSGYFNWGAAAMLAVVMVLVAVAVLIIQKYVVERGNYTSVSGRSGKPKPLGDRKTGWVMFVVSSLMLLPSTLAIAGVGYLSLVGRFGRGFVAETFTLSHYYRALVVAPKPVMNSLILSFGATAVAVVYALVISYVGNRTRLKGRSILDGLSMLPFVVPGTAIAVALIVTFNQPPIRLHNTAWILVVAYVIRRMPYAVRNLSAGFQQLDRSMDESALVMGASRPFIAWTVLVPLLIPSMLAAGLLVFVTSIKEVSTSIMLSPAQWRPLSAQIYQLLLEQETSGAAAYAVVLIVMVGVLQWLANRAAKRQSSS